MSVLTALKGILMMFLEWYMIPLSIPLFCSFCINRNQCYCSLLWLTVIVCLFESSFIDNVCCEHSVWSLRCDSDKKIILILSYLATRKELLGIKRTWFHGSDSFPVTQPTVSKYQRKLKALNPSNEPRLISSPSITRLLNDAHGSIYCWLSNGSSTTSMKQLSVKRIRRSRHNEGLREPASWVHCPMTDHQQNQVAPAISKTHNISATKLVQW